MLLGLPTPDPGLEVSIASHGISGGLSQTQGGQVILRATMTFRDVQVGAQWRNVSNPAARGVAALFAKFRSTSGKTEFEVGAFYLIRTGRLVPRHATAWEFDGTVRRHFGRLSLRAAAEYSPKDFESGPSLYVELGPSVAISNRMNLSINIGRKQSDDPDYTTFNLGLTRSIGEHVSLDARVYRTDHGERGRRYGTRLIVAGRVVI